MNYQEYAAQYKELDIQYKDVEKRLSELTPDKLDDYTIPRELLDERRATFLSLQTERSTLLFAMCDAIENMRTAP